MEENRSSINILFVCYGNTCRSPMAEYMLRDMVARDPALNHNGITISSAGIGENMGYPASDQTLLVSRERGLKDIIQHKGRQINPEMLNQSDIILVMEDIHREVILSGFPDVAGRMFLLSEYAGDSGNIEDPSGQPTAVYRATAEIIQGYLSIVVDKLRETLEI
jgi:protein-tyrosine-phosphatase